MSLVLTDIGTTLGMTQTPVSGIAVGCAVCLLTVAMGIYMIRRANREIKNLQETQNGE